MESKEENLDKKVIEVYELNNISEFLKDDDVTRALALVVKLISKPEIPVKSATPLILKFSALSLKCRMQAKNYMLIDKTAENASQKKNLYLTFADALDEVVNSLKYITKMY